MSTRATIIYNEENGVHIYQDLLDGQVYLEIDREGSWLIVRLMTVKEWLALGLLNIADKV